MGTTEDRLRVDMKDAMRAKDAPRTQVIRGLLAAAKNRAIELKTDHLEESELIAVFKKEAKQRQEALEFARKAAREELISEQVAAIAVVESYLPKQLSEAEITAAVEQIIAETGVKEMGPLMKELGKRHAGLYDGKLASGIVNAIVRGTGR